LKKLGTRSNNADMVKIILSSGTNLNNNPSFTNIFCGIIEAPASLSLGNGVSANGNNTFTGVNSFTGLAVSIGLTNTYVTPSTATIYDANSVLQSSVTTSSELAGIHVGGTLASVNLQNGTNIFTSGFNRSNIFMAIGATNVPADFSGGPYYNIIAPNTNICFNSFVNGNLNGGDISYRIWGSGSNCTIFIPTNFWPNNILLANTNLLKFYAAGTNMSYTRSNNADPVIVSFSINTNANNNNSFSNMICAINESPVFLGGGGSVAASVVGTTAAGNATAGYVGEFVNSLVASGSPVSLTTATPANVTSISLTAGDWDVEGNINFSASSATVTGTQGGISTTTASLPTDGSEVYSGVQVTLLSEKDSVSMPRKRINVSSTTTVFLVAQSTFSAGSVGAFGTINARRVR